MPGRTARSVDTASPAHDAKARPPGTKRPGCVTLSLRLSPQLRDLDIPKRRDSCHPADSPQEGADYGQSPAWSLLPEETAPQEPHRQQETGCAYRALPKKSFRAATTWVTYSGLSYRSTWLAPSTTWIFLGSLARR